MIFSTTFKHAIALLLTTLGMTTGAMAAQVPAGVTLAEKQELVRNNGDEVSSLDPHKVEGIPENNVISDLMEGLVQVDNEGKIEPAMAIKWEQQDFKVWTFHLRPDAKWSNGDPVTAEDFVYGWQRIVDPATASPYATYLVTAYVQNAQDIVNGKKDPNTLGIKALDKNTLQVTLSESVPYFYKILYHYSTFPLHRASIEKYGDKWTQPGNYVSNGAYTLAEWRVNEKIVVKRNSLYWDNQHTVLEQVTFLPISSEVTDVNRYRSGEIDMTYNNLPVELFHKMKKEKPAEVYSTPMLCTYFYELNNQKPPLNDVRVRSALKLALDRDILANKVKNQGDVPAYTYTPPYTDGIGKLPAPAWSQKTQEQLNQQAQKLLREAGYSKENPVKLTLLYNTSDMHEKLAIAAVSIWKKNLAGMAEIQLQNQEWKTFLETRRLGKQQIARGGWCADYNEPSAFLNTVMSNSSNNRFFYKNSEYDALMQKTLTVQTDAERAELYHQAEAKIDQDSVMVPVYYYADTRFIKPYVRGYTGKNPINEVKSKDLYIIRQ